MNGEGWPRARWKPAAYAKPCKRKTCAIRRIGMLAHCKRAAVLNVYKLAHILQTIRRIDRRRSNGLICAIAVRFRSVTGHDPANPVHPAHYPSLIVTDGFFK
ncbi:hypothetical protein [Paraburkholderia sp. SIMBA_030]|uniref:hypothetical protein n=1 Tax=Paraburkholderia sp. SIMBA_030 TaxID=3085773 RepID=UPI00397C8937